MLCCVVRHYIILYMYITLHYITLHYTIFLFFFIKECIILYYITLYYIILYYIILYYISPINCGVPQGSIIGPLLFLLYINDLPNCLARACPRMYADDTNITVSANNAADLKTMLNDELSNLNLWLRANKLSLNITKTEYMIIGSRQRLRATTENQIIEVCIEGKKITRVAESKSLGVYKCDKEPESFINPTDKTFSFKKSKKKRFSS